MHALFAFDRKLPEAPGDHENDGGQQQEIGVDQDDDQDVVGEGTFKSAVLDLQDNGERRQNHEAEEVQQALCSRLLLFPFGRHGAEYQKDRSKARFGFCSTSSPG